jgi:hypothetical protein
VTLPIGLEQSRLELAKAKLGFERQEKALERLKADREALVLRAPAAGFAVRGSFARGKWNALDEMARNLEPGQKAPANQVLWTILTPGALGVHVDVVEARVLEVRKGQSGTASPTALDGLSLPVTVARVAPVSSDGKYDVSLDLGTPDERLMPGFACKVKLTLATREAVTVPAGAVGRDGDQAYVHVVVDGKGKRRDVKAGATSGGRTEIREGLAGGEKVLEQAPKAK